MQYNGEKSRFYLLSIKSYESLNIDNLSIIESRYFKDNTNISIKAFILRISALIQNKW